MSPVFFLRAGAVPTHQGLKDPARTKRGGRGRTIDGHAAVRWGDAESLAGLAEASALVVRRNGTEVQWLRRVIDRRFYPQPLQRQKKLIIIAFHMHRNRTQHVRPAKEQGTGGKLLRRRREVVHFILLL